MSEHPVRLVMTDDLQRSRWTVAFRLLLAIPHFIWLSLWSFLAVLAAILNWLVTLIAGRSPLWLHSFLAAYVKYVTQLSGYLRLAANPYPSFDAPDGYPVDLVIAPPAPQRRWRTLLRLPLAYPAMMLAATLSGGGSLSVGRRGVSQGGVGDAVTFFAWFACLARGRMPRGMRDMLAWSLSYGAQFWAYLLLLTDRYPDSDPIAALPEVPDRTDPISVHGEDDLHRSRLTVFFRLPLAFPHLLWLVVWQLLVVPAAIVNWVATLIAGRSPARLHGFLAAYLRYLVSVYAFLLIVANPFPGFAGAPGAYPFDTTVAAPERQSRWTVLFRLLLGLPAIVIATTFTVVALVVAILSWFSALARGRVPRGLRNSGAVALRYYAQTHGYLLLLTGSYPYTGPSLSDDCGPRETPGG